MHRRTCHTAIALAAMSVLLGGCNALNRLSYVGSQPPLTKIQNPTTEPGYLPVAMPMPAPVMPEQHANSLWRPGSRAFLKDQRASQVGDIVTVTIDIADQAQITNQSKRERGATESAAAKAFLGYESELDRPFPATIQAGNLIGLNSGSTTNGTGTINRGETIAVKIAAVVTQVLPNGNLVVQGRQEVRVNFETRDLVVAGIIRPQDITSTNIISYEKIAEARISYGGRGQISDVQQPRYGQQILDILFPF